MEYKQDIYDLLDRLKIDYEAIEHEAVFTMDELTSCELPHKEYDTKNLFVRDDKHMNYWLITVRGNKKIDLKEFRKMMMARPIKFCDEGELYSKLGLTPGSVSPFGLLNDPFREVMFVLDEDFFKDEALIGCHPNDNTATVFMKTEDLKRVIEDHKSPMFVIKIPVKENAQS